MTPGPAGGDGVPVVRRRPDITVASVGPSLLAYDRGHESAHLLNPAAAAVWELIDGVRTPDAITDALRARFADVPATIGTEVETVLADLAELGLATTNGTEPTAPTGGPVRTPPAVGLVPTTDREAPAAEPVAVGPFDALGFGFDIVAEADIANRFARTLRSLRSAPGPRDDDGGRPHHRDAGHRYVIARRIDDDPPDSSVELWFDDAVVHAGPLSSLSSYLLWHVNNRAVESDHPGLLIHASAVLTEAGAVALSGTMDAGKSTLVTALAARGRPYVTDEAVAIAGADDAVEAYPKPIGIDPGSWTLFPELAASAHPDVTTRWWLDPEAVGPGASAVPNRSRHRLAAIVFVRYRPGVATALRPLDPPEAALALTSNLFNLAGDPRRGIDTVVRLTGSRPCFQLDIGPLTDAVATLDTLFATLP